MNIRNRVLPALGAAAAILLLAAIASAQEAAPPAQTEAVTSEPTAEAKKIIAVARFEDRDGAVKDAAIVVTLDTTLWSTLAGRKQSRFDVVRLDPQSPAGCGIRCALDAARAAGAAYLVRGETQRVEDKLLATIEIVSVQTGAVMQSHRSELVTEAAFLVETTADAIRRAADQVFTSQDDQAAANPPKASRPIIAVAHLEDVVPALHPEFYAALDDAVYLAIAGLGQTRYKISRLAAQDDPCDLACAVAMAKAAGAAYVLWTAIERDADQMRVAASMSSTSSGRSIRDSRSNWVSEFRQLKLEVDQVSREMADLLLGSSAHTANASQVASNPDAGSDAADVARALAEYRQKTIESPAFNDARSKRNAGVALFVFGTIFDVVGGGLIGAGQPARKQGLVISGYVVGGTGVIMFFSGIGLWVANQIRMNKMERGIPLARSLRLDGLSPIVASRDRGAPGLSARFSF